MVCQFRQNHALGVALVSLFGITVALWGSGLGPRIGA